MANVVGPGSQIQDKNAPEPMLLDASEYEYVTLHNPLSDDFQVMVAQDVPVNVPFEIRKDSSGKTTFLTNTAQDAKMVYGLDLKNPEHQSKKYIHNTAIIPAGGTMNFRGNEAKVACTQLVNEIMQREGNRRFIADPVKRNEVEQRIIKKRGSVQALMEGQLTTPQAQAQAAVERSNSEQFPGLKQATESTNQGTEEAPAPATDTPESDNPQPERAKPAKKPATATK